MLFKIDFHDFCAFQKLPETLLCVDSLSIFKKIDKLQEQRRQAEKASYFDDGDDECLAVAAETSDDVVTPGAEPPTMTSDLGIKDLDELLTLAREMQKANETTPKHQRCLPPDRNIVVGAKLNVSKFFGLFIVCKKKHFFIEQTSAAAAADETRRKTVLI